MEQDWKGQLSALAFLALLGFGGWWAFNAFIDGPAKHASLVVCTPDSQIDNRGFCSKPAMGVADVEIRANVPARTVELTIGNTSPTFLSNCTMSDAENWVCPSNEGETGMRTGRLYMALNSGGSIAVTSSVVGWQAFAYRHGLISLGNALQYSGAPDWAIDQTPVTSPVSIKDTSKSQQPQSSQKTSENDLADAAPAESNAAAVVTP